MRDHDELSPKLKKAVALLRELPAPRASWRTELLRRVAEGDAPVPLQAQPRRWSMRPATAIAAGILCAIVGFSGARLLDEQPIARVAEQPAALTPIRFALIAPSAVRVSIVGDFNRWDATALPLRRSADGRTWEIEVRLPPGRYSYAFLVDGRLARDPTAPQDVGDDFGTPNSIVMVKGS